MFNIISCSKFASQFAILKWIMIPNYAICTQNGIFNSAKKSMGNSVYS